MNRLVILDGNAILHRAFHALPPLTDPEGNVVNAVYGFVTMLLRIIHDLTPQYVAVAFDRPQPTFRKELFEKYQATRPKMDETLVPQIEKVHEVLRAFQIPIFEMDGFEADDVMGTIVKKCPFGIAQGKQMLNLPAGEAGAKCQIIIVTGDRDILQLVEDEKVFVYMPTKGLSEAKLYGEKEVKERMGVTPKQIADFKALAGDASDNYPGVEGIGPKTAIKLLEEFGSVEELYKAIEKDGPAFARLSRASSDKSDTVKEKLIKDKENALLSHQLATIRQDVPIDIELKPLGDLNTPEAREALGKFGFASLVKRLAGRSASANVTEGKKKKNNEIQSQDPEQMTLV